MTDANQRSAGGEAADRRHFLTALAASGLAALSGCVAGDDASPAATTTTADGDRTTTAGAGGTTRRASPTPDGGRPPAPPAGDHPDYPDADRVVLHGAVDPDAEPVVLVPSGGPVGLPRGAVTLSLRNGGDAPVSLNPYGWRLDRYEDGWHRIAPDAVPQPLTRVGPGGRHEWRLTVDNRDLGTVGVPTGDGAVTVAGLGAGTYAFAAFPRVEGGAGDERVAAVARFVVDGGPLALSFSDRVTAVERTGDRVVVEAAGQNMAGSRRAAFVLRRAPGADPVRTLVTERAIREWPLRDALAAIEPGVESVRVETTTASDPPFADAGRPAAGSPLAYDGETYALEAGFVGDGM